MDTTNKLVKLFRIDHLHYIAYEAYKSGKYQQGVDLYNEAIMLSKKINNTERIVRYKFWKAACLVVLNRYKETLAECLEAIKYKDKKVDKGDLFNIYMLMIGTGYKIPTSIESIEHSFRQADLYMEKVGEPHWRSLFLLERSDFLEIRGKYDEALDSVLEAWSLYSHRYPSNIPGSYMSRIIHLLIHLRDFSAIPNYFEKWDNLMNIQPVNRVVRKAKAAFLLARAKQNKAEALKIARQLDSCDSGLYDGLELIDAYLINGLTDLVVRPLAVYIRKKRNSQSLFQRLSCYRLICDYHLVILRQCANLPKLDFDFDKYSANGKISLDNRIPPNKLKKMRSHHKRAKNAHKNAISIAEEIDTRLKCDVYRKEINKRWQLIQQIV